jgi:hypothetical protein
VANESDGGLGRIAEVVGGLRSTRSASLAAAAASQEAVNESRALADMGMQWNSVQVVAQDRVGGDYLPRTAVIGLPLTVVPLPRLGWATIAMTFVAIAARPAGLRFEFAIPVVVLRVAVAIVGSLSMCRTIYDDCSHDGQQYSHYEDRDVVVAHCNTQA